MRDVAGTRDVLRRIVERADLDALTEGVLASFVDRPEFRQQRPPRDALRAWVRWNIELVMRWFLDGQPPTDEELERFRALARASATDGTPADTVPANYRLGARYAWKALLEAAADDERGALLESSDLLLEYVDRVSREFFQAYDDVARSGGPSAQERGAQALLARLTRGEDLLAEDHQLAEQIGFDLDGPLRPFVLCSLDRTADQHAALARRARARHALASSRGRYVTGVAHECLPWRDLGAGSAATFATGERTLRSELGAALDELRIFVDVASARGHAGPVPLDEYLAEAMLHRSPRIARRLHARIYGPLPLEIARTLDSLIEHQLDRASTAAALPVHRNTLANRIKRIHELTGVDLDRVDGVALAWLAWLERARHR